MHIFQELLYNPVGGTGWMVSRLKTIRQKSKSVTSNQMQNITENGSDYSSIDESDPAEDLQILRSLVPNKENIKDIHTKLLNTMELRKKMFEDKNLNLLVHFPYFFHTPELVRNVLIFIYFFMLYSNVDFISCVNLRFCLILSTASKMINQWIL